MKAWLKRHLKRRMMRPIAYKAVSRFLVALTVALLWERYVNTGGLLPMSHAFTILGVIFLGMAWFNYLFLDGVRLELPLISRLRSFRKKKRPSGAFWDVPELLDQEPVAFEELPEEERYKCLLATNVICGAVFLLLSLI